MDDGYSSIIITLGIGPRHHGRTRAIAGPGRSPREAENRFGRAGPIESTAARWATSPEGPDHPSAVQDGWHGGANGIWPASASPAPRGQRPKALSLERIRFASGLKRLGLGSAVVDPIVPGAEYDPLRLLACSTVRTVVWSCGVFLRVRTLDRGFSRILVL